MNARNTLFGLLAAISLFFVCAPASAQVVADGQVPIIYIGDFTPALPTAEAESGMFRHMKAEHDDKKIDANAHTLADAVVAALHAKGVVAYRVSAAQPAPASGWLVDGNYRQTISHNPFPMISALLKPSQPNTDASIRITDLSGERAGTPAGFSTAANMKGQGSSFSTNPYKIAAHIVIHRVEANASMNALANAIADRIVSIDTQAHITASSSGDAVAQLP